MQGEQDQANRDSSEKISRRRQEVTEMLQQWTSGDLDAGDQVLEELYLELKSLARRALGHERANHTLQPTALLNEAYLRLVDLDRIEWQDRDHFLRAAAKTMRRVMVDHARHRKRVKRGSGQIVLPMDENENIAVRLDEDLEMLDSALKAMAEVDPQKAELVELRFFGGYSLEQVAALQQVSRPTVVRQWRLARAFLRDWMS